MTISLWRYLVDTTNEYARSRIGRMPPQCRSLFRWWRDVTVEEMKAFVGVIINMGMLKLTDIKEYWSTHTTTNLPFFRRVFSRDRFLQIYWMLHVGDLSSTTKCAKVQPFVDKVIPLFQQYLIPSRELSIDEAMIAFRGKVAFRVYIRGKPHPWGIKAYVLSESRSGYLHNIIIYYGKETKIVHIPGLNHTTNVVLTLMAPLANKGYDLYTDRYYTSPQLARQLLEIGTTITGTVMVNRRGMPAATKAKYKGKKGDVSSFTNGALVVMQWTDKRTLTTLSTKYGNKMVSIPSRYEKIMSSSKFLKKRGYTCRNMMYGRVV